MSRKHLVLFACAVLLMSGLFVWRQNNRSEDSFGAASSNVSVNEGEQSIRIQAKGGYFPRVTTARAGLPTMLHVETNGTFDCSTALTIPEVGYRGALPSSGITSIKISPQLAGTTVRGVCSMGMYSFTVRFE